MGYPISMIFLAVVLLLSAVQSFQISSRGSITSNVRQRLPTTAQWIATSGFSTSHQMSTEDVEVPLVIDAQESTSTEVVADAAPKKKGLFGLSVTDPQDWITVFLSGVIIYQTIDLIAFYGAKLLGNGSP